MSKSPGRHVLCAVGSTTPDKERDLNVNASTNQPNPGSVPVMRFIRAAESPRSRMGEMLSVPKEQRDVNWLQASLQIAVELELSTLPPYLCGLWSILTPSGPVHDNIRTIVLEEMGHMGLACNMLTTIGGTPQINTPGAVPKYPGHLPGGVRPQLTVSLVGLTKEVVLNTYMEIEKPESGPIGMHQGMTYPTIGAFYDALLDAFRQVSASTFTGARQLTAGGPVGVFAIHTLADAERAIEKIKEQGEGTSQSPLAVDFGNELAHYFRFAEIYHGRTLIEMPDHQYDYKGAPIPFPDAYPMAEVPPGGYPESRAFDELYTSVLNLLQNAWQQGSQAQLGQAVAAMRALAAPARQLMQKPRPDGKGNFGPSFLLISGSSAGAMNNKINSYADVKKLFDNFVQQSQIPIGSAPHHDFWNQMSYEEFKNGDVPDIFDPDTNQPLNLKILVVGKSSESNIILALRGSGPLFNPTDGSIGPMPPGGPMLPPEQIAELADWIDRGCPNGTQP